MPDLKVGAIMPTVLTINYAITATDRRVKQELNQLSQDIKACIAQGVDNEPKLTAASVVVATRMSDHNLVALTEEANWQDGADIRVLIVKTPDSPEFEFDTVGDAADTLAQAIHNAIRGFIDQQNLITSLRANEPSVQVVFCFKEEIGTATFPSPATP